MILNQKNTQQQLKETLNSWGFKKDDFILMPQHPKIIYFTRKGARRLRKVYINALGEMGFEVLQ